MRVCVGWMLFVLVCLRVRVYKHVSTYILCYSYLQIPLFFAGAVSETLKLASRPSMVSKNYF